MLKFHEQAILNDCKAEVRDIEAALRDIAAREAAANPSWAAPSNAAASAAAGDDPELWRIVTGANMLRSLLDMLDDDALSFTERCRRVGSVVKGVFHGWADSRASFSEMMGRHGSVYKRLVRLCASADAHCRVEQ